MAPGDGDDDTVDDGGHSLSCPDQDPTEGEPCTAPEGTTCPAGACDDTYVACRKGIWTLSSVPPAEVLCPAAAPAEGDDCPRCFPSTLVCAFGCNEGEGSRAVCVREADGRARWRVTERSCPSFDGGADADPQDGS